MRVTAERFVQGVLPDEAVAWWADFRDGKSDHGFFPGGRRTIVARGDAHVTMEDRWLGFFPETTTAKVEGRTVRFVGRNLVATFDGTYTFEEAPGGTRIRLDAEVRLRPVLRWSERVAKPIADRIVALDLAGHARDLANERR